MGHTILLRDLASVSEQEFERRVTASAQVKPNGSLLRLHERIATFEHQHKMTTAEMQAGLARGEISETFEIAQWLIAVQTRDLVENR